MNRPATIKRGQVVAAFLLVTAAFVTATIIATRASDRANRAVAKVAEQRRVTVRRFRATDVEICRAVNRITQRDRQTITSGPSTLRAELRILRVDDKIAARLVVQQEQQVARELARRPLLNCSALPSLRPPAS